MTPSEFACALKTTQEWDQQMDLLSRAWKTAQKQFHDQPDKLYYAWEELMGIYERR